MSNVETGQPDAVEAAEEQKLTEKQAAEVAERAQYGQTGDMVDPGMGNMGGTGASGTGPDIAEQSSPTPGNHADLPAASR